ncbi:MAG: LytTR family DNA-binding domain-containing protein [Bacteroidota bacterium]
MTSKPQAEAKAKVIPLPFTKIQHHYLDKMAIPSQGKVEFIHANKIICIQACGNYSKIHLAGNKRFTACITLKRFEERLNPVQFIRVHQGSIVNTHYIECYLQNENKLLLLNSMLINVSRSRKPIINQFIKHITL